MEKSTSKLIHDFHEREMGTLSTKIEYLSDSLKIIDKKIDDNIHLVSGVNKRLEEIERFTGYLKRTTCYILVLCGAGFTSIGQHMAGWVSHEIKEYYIHAEHNDLAQGNKNELYSKKSIQS